MQWSEYNYIYESPKHGTLLFNLICGAFIDISDPEAKNEISKLKENPDAYDFSNVKENYEFLLSAGIICENDEDNRNIMNFKLLRVGFTPKHEARQSFRLWIAISLANIVSRKPTDESKRCRPKS